MRAEICGSIYEGQECSGVSIVKRQRDIKQLWLVLHRKGLKVKSMTKAVLLLNENRENCYQELLVSVQNRCNNPPPCDAC